MENNAIATAVAPDRTSAPAISEFGALTLPCHEERILPNGIRLTSVNNGSQPVYRLTLRWDGGTLDTPCQEVHQIMAATINEGTTGRSGREIAETLEYNGAWIRYDAMQHFFSATLFGLTARVPEVLEIFTDVLTNAVFPQEAVAARCEKFAAQCLTEREKITSKVQDVFLPMTYGPGTPRAHRPTHGDYLAVTPEMVHEHYHRHLKATPPRAYLAGNITPELLALVTAALGKMEFTTVEDPIKIRLIAPVFNPAGDLRRLSVADSLQSAIKIAIPAIGRDNPDFQALRIASVAFGGHFGSRLMQNIREDKGYTYGINATLSAFPGEGSFLVINCQTDNRFTDAVLTEISAELRRMVSEPLSPEEFTGVRRLLLSALAGVLDSPFTICDYIINQQAAGMDPSQYTHIQDVLRAITPEAISEVFNNYISPSSQLIAIAGK